MDCQLKKLAYISFVLFLAVSLLHAQRGLEGILSPAPVSGGGQTWAFKQASSSESGGGTNQITFAGTTAGDALVACAGLYNATLGITVTDTSNTYNTLVSFSNAAGSAYCAVALNIAGGADTISFNVTPIFDVVFVVTEYSGVATSSAIDQTQGGINSAVTSWTSTATGTNTAQTNELGVGFCTYQNSGGNGGVFSQGSGWTSHTGQSQQGGTAWGSIMEDMNLSTLTTYTATATTTLTDTGPCIIATLKHS